jgi:xanthine dehydrogenase accessory factor
MARVARERGGALTADLLERAAELKRTDQPFVLATVVRSLKPASARAGDRAVILADRRTEGWVGGGCVHTTIEREAMQALADGAPRLVRLSPDQVEEDGVVSYPMTCHSGGTLDIYLEPVLPAPQLVILGESHVAEALKALGEPLGFRIVDSLDAITNSRDAWVVAAGMSSGEDHPVVRAALELDVPYVAMVASARRAGAYFDELRSEGISEDVLSRLKAPAGLDIGAATGPEIALSILAEIVKRRRTEPKTAQATPEALEMAIDPVCGMEVDPRTARWTAERGGQTYYFCAPGCRKAFLATPV